MKQIDFELTSPFKFAGPNGVEVECSHITLHEPTGKVSHICCAIEGLIKSATVNSLDLIEKLGIEAEVDAAAASAPDPEEVKDGTGVLMVMASGGADMEKLVLHFRELFKQVAWMGGEKLITSARLDDMSHTDLRKMIGVYAENFITGW